jgi:hypothetical protein
VPGHGRYLPEELGPKLRQYIFAGNNEELPFIRDQRHWIYCSASKGNNYFGFGTDNDLEQTLGYMIVKQSTFPSAQGRSSIIELMHNLPALKTINSFTKLNHFRFHSWP